MNMYKKLLRELNKGNAVLLEVVDKDGGDVALDRYRLATPETVLYSYIKTLSDNVKADKELTTSCYVSQLRRKNRTAKAIVERMERYDKAYAYAITKMQVLK